MSDKDVLRAAALAARAAVAEPGLCGARACGHLRAWLARHAPQAPLAGYFPIRGELDPRPVLAAHAGPTALPVVPGFRQPLVFRAWRLGEPVIPGPFGTFQPVEAAESVQPQVVIVPLAGFDRRGARIGYGGGFYDRTLELLRGLGPVTAIGLGFAAQEVGQVPEEPFDQPLDLIVTEAGILLPQRD